MKNYLRLFSLLIVMFGFTSFKEKNATQRIYPEIESFFQKMALLQPNQDHINNLENLKYNLNISEIDHDVWNFVFYCSENSFRSQASQIFMQTLCYNNKFKNAKVYSAGLTPKEIDIRLINFLTKVGYKIKIIQINRHQAYEIKYSDRTDPIVLFSKNVDDVSLPKKDIISVIVCDRVKEKECSTIQTPTTPYNLPFKKISETDNIQNAENLLHEIAAEMLYAVKK